MQKICDDYEAAKIRIDTIAAPKNAKRLKLNTPCELINVTPYNPLISKC